MAYGNITKALAGIANASTPERFTQDFLSTKLGLKGGSARPVIPFLKRVGFLTSDGAPTELYKRYRNETHRGSALAAAIRQGTPDTIDLLVVCTEAGMGLESGLERVAEEMKHTNPAMTGVLYGLLDDLRILPNRSDAFEKFGDALGQVAEQLGESFVEIIEQLIPDLPDLADAFTECVKAITPLIPQIADLVKALTPLFVMAAKFWNFQP